jgi:membrane fusion protein (multidrug efflux system)
MSQRETDNPGSSMEKPERRGWAGRSTVPRRTNSGIFSPYPAVLTGLVLGLLVGAPGAAQQASSTPPAVGVVAATRQPITQSTEYIGRIQATRRVNLVARVGAFLDQCLFTEGVEVKQGDLLYRLEQGPFQADVQVKEATVAQFKAQLQNAQVTLGRAQTLLGGPAGQQSTVDAALANHKALQAQVLGAEGQLQQSQINLGYSEIRAPIDGKIGRTAVTSGNYVNTGTGALVSIVSQDPMYVLFPISTRNVIELRRRSTGRAGAGVIKLRLPDGQLYNQVGKLDFVDNTVSANTDTMILRGVVPNPALANTNVTTGTRELVDGELVTVILEDAQPTESLAVPRAAVLTDQRGDYVYVVGADNRAQQRRIQLGQSTATAATVMGGLNEGENVVVDGVQRVRAGQAVSPGPANPSTPTTPATGARPSSG